MLATDTTLSIYDIEDRLAELGYTTSYVGEEHFTSYSIAGDSHMIEILDGVSGEYFRTEHVTEVNVYIDGRLHETVTNRFEDIETEDGFIETVKDLLA